jgi:opacity protein-like surface antigen
MKKIGFAILFAVSVGTATSAALAQTTQPARARPDADTGFYVRGSLGYSWSAEDEIDYSPVWGLGVGYRITPNLRADFTFDWRDRYILESGAFDTQLENQSYMLNVYYDLDQIPVIQLPGGFKPYVGAGIGLSYIEVNDQAIPGAGGTVARVLGDDDVNLAWQLMFGVGYQVTPKFAADVGYRYARLGEAQLSSPQGSIENDLNAQEIILTVRYNF